MHLPWPAELPNLEELVILSNHILQLPLRDPVATASTLNTICMFGQPPTTNGLDMLRMASSLTSRGLSLAAVSNEATALGKTAHEST